MRWLRPALVLLVACSGLIHIGWPMASALDDCTTTSPHANKTKCLDVIVCTTVNEACNATEAWTEPGEYSKSCIGNGDPAANCVDFTIVCVTKVECDEVQESVFASVKCEVGDNVQDPAGEDIVRETDVVGDKSCTPAGT